MEETLSKVEAAIDSKSQLHHVVVNAGKIVQMQNDLQLRKSVNSCDINNADGQAVVWAANFLNKPLKERVAGIDLMQNLVKLAASKKYKIYFLGAEEAVVSKTVAHYSKEFGQEIVAGYRNGYYQTEGEKEVINDIASSKANILFVAITSPKKENFLYKYKKELAAVNFIMGVGGSFDVIAGKTKRAPAWMQDIGLEWFYRFLQEPKRMWKRYLVGNSKFILLVLKEKLKVKQ
jgi:N-acetylglucosaminyldiphosphoundecaprenol N-acetyl-beta-D-mannosaminyltransferase